MAQRDQIALH